MQKKNNLSINFSVRKKEMQLLCLIYYFSCSLYLFVSAAEGQREWGLQVAVIRGNRWARARLVPVGHLESWWGLGLTFYNFLSGLLTRRILIIQREGFHSAPRLPRSNRLSRSPSTFMLSCSGLSHSDGPVLDDGVFHMHLLISVEVISLKCTLEEILVIVVICSCVSESFQFSPLTSFVLLVTLSNIWNVVLEVTS